MLVWRQERIQWKQIYMCSIDLQNGGGRRDRKASILLSWQQAQTDTKSASEPREEGCVCLCVWRKVEKETVGCPRQTGRLHFHRCSFCMWGERGMIRRKVGSLSGRERWGHCFCDSRFMAGPAGDKPVKAAKLFGLARHLSWWNHAAENQSSSSCLSALSEATSSAKKQIYWSGC